MPLALSLGGDTRTHDYTIATSSINNTFRFYNGYESLYITQIDHPMKYKH